MRQKPSICYKILSQNRGALDEFLAGNLFFFHFSILKLLDDVPL